ncbi:hypothetical protein [Nonomuraea sp. NPDC050643]|uniref:hypothetical protein n=1 Tax=Nonomuraea sp. NPDC050643 TaxID=3155660 RepID=UPI0033CA48F9
MTHEDQPRLARSETRRLKDDRVGTWSNLDDYLKFFIDINWLPDGSTEETLVDHPEVCNEIIRHWLGQGQTSCRFASGLARKLLLKEQNPEQEPEIVKWRAFIFSRKLSGATFCDDMRNILRSAKDPGVEAIHFVFPYVRSPGALVDLINALSSCDGWWWVPISQDSQGNPTPRDEMLISLRYLISTEESVASWTLGFGPFDFLAFTRRAPITTIAMRVNSKKRVTTDAPDQLGNMPVHLADMDSLISREKFPGVVCSTENNKKNILNDELLRAARARVTFRIPMEYADRLIHKPSP